jgi:Rad3-related DNA helicase
LAQAVLDWYETGQKYLVLVAPTGTGKSLLSLVAQRALNATVHTLVSTLRLQDQMHSSYSDAPILKGRDNYSCLIVDAPVSQAPCQIGYKCALITECPYFVDRKSTFASEYAVFNYALYLALSQAAQRPPTPDILFCDEAHLIEGEQERFLSATITERDIKFEGWTRPKVTTVGELADWAEGYLQETIDEIERYRRRIFGAFGAGGKSISNPAGYSRLISKYNHYRYLGQLLQTLILAGRETENGRQWVLDKEDGTYQVRPVQVKEYSGVLFNLSERVVLMSATMSRADVERLGITDYTYLQVPSAYPPERRPVHYQPVGYMSRGNERNLLPEVVRAMDGIIAKHSKLGQKGLVHTVSYDRAEMLCKRSRFGKLAMTHDNDNKSLVIAEFKESKEPVVLFSPSVIEGEDFPGDECSYVIIPKIPFASLGDSLVKEKRGLDPQWYSWSALKDVIQGAGRGMRSVTDYCSIYILDSNFEKIVEEHIKEIPHWFLEAIVDLSDEFREKAGMNGTD